MSIERRSQISGNRSRKTQQSQRNETDAIDDDLLDSAKKLNDGNNLQMTHNRKKGEGFLKSKTILDAAGEDNLKNVSTVPKSKVQRFFQKKITIDEQIQEG